MFKRIVFIIFLLFGSITMTYGQWQTSKTASAGICVGPSFPLGVFGKDNYSEELPREGMADRGLGFKVYIRKKLHPNVGVNANFSGVFHPVNEKGLDDEMTLTNINFDDYIIESTNWEHYTFLVGMAGILQLIPSELDLDFKAQTGYCHAYTPEIIQKVEYNGETEVFPKEDKKNKGAIPLNLGVGFNYYISPRIIFSADIDYFGAEPMFPRDNNVSPIEIRDMFINTINIMLGMGYRF